MIVFDDIMHERRFVDDRLRIDEAQVQHLLVDQSHKTVSKDQRTVSIGAPRKLMEFITDLALFNL